MRMTNFKTFSNRSSPWSSIFKLLFIFHLSIHSYPFQLRNSIPGEQQQLRKLFRGHRLRTTRENKERVTLGICYFSPPGPWIRFTLLFHCLSTRDKLIIPSSPSSSSPTPSSDGPAQPASKAMRVHPLPLRKYHLLCALNITSIPQKNNKENLTTEKQNPLATFDFHRLSSFSLHSPPPHNPDTANHRLWVCDNTLCDTSARNSCSTIAHHPCDNASKKHHCHPEGEYYYYYYNKLVLNPFSLTYLGRWYDNHWSCIPIRCLHSGHLH